MEVLEKLKLKEGETVIQEIHHHGIIIFPHIVISVLIIIFNFFLMYWLLLQGTFGLILFLSVLFVVGLYIFRIVFLYKKNKVIITDQRIVDFERAGFFEKYINQIKYKEIESIEINQKGLLSKIFKYGDIKIKLNDDVAPFELYKIKYPDKYKLIIEKRMINKVDYEVDKSHNMADDVINPRQKDPVTFILGEVSLLSRKQKVVIVKEIKNQLRQESNNFENQ